MDNVATKINFDVGVIGKLDVRKFKNVLVLTGMQYSLEIFEKQVRPLIKKANCHVFTSIPVHLTDSVVYSVMNYAVDKKIDCIISVGVESVMDCGRLVSLLLSHGGYLHDYLPGGKVGPYGIMPNVIHHITVPIMPAAGYEISSYASFRIDGDKKMLISPYLVPKATYIDPNIMKNLPPDLWAVLGFDCFATSFMAYVSAYANPTSDAFALQALGSYADYYAKIIREPSNIEHIKHAAIASINAFLAANYSGTGAVHAIADALSAKFGLRYGTALAMVCPEVCAFLYPANKQRFDHVMKMLGGKGGSAVSVKNTISELINKNGIQLPPLIGKLSTEEVDKLARESMNYAMRGSAKKMTEKDVKGILGRLS